MVTLIKDNNNAEVIHVLRGLISHQKKLILSDGTFKFLSRKSCNLSEFSALAAPLNHASNHQSIRIIEAKLCFFLK